MSYDIPKGFVILKGIILIVSTVMFIYQAVTAISKLIDPPVLDSTG